MSLGFNSSGKNTNISFLGAMRGAGSVTRKYNYCRTNSDAIFCLFDPNCCKKVEPIKPVYTLYYNKSDINNFKLPVNYDTELINNLNYNKYQQSNLYNKNHDKTLGTIFYDISISNSENGIYDVEKSYLTLNDKENSMLLFTISILNKSEAGYLNSGTYTFQITGGTGTFKNAKGYIKFIVINYERKLEIYLKK